MKKSLFVFLSAICLCFFACNKTQSKTLLDQIKTRGEIVVAVEGVWEPWSFHDAQNQLVGFDVDVAKEMCRRMGIKPRFIEVEWERLLDSLEKRECDIVVNGVAITPERQERFYYTTPYAFEKFALIVRDNNTDITSFKDLAGKTSVNSRGSTFCDIAEQNGAISIVVDTFEETINLLLQRRVESTINSFFTYYSYMKSNSHAPLKIAALSDYAEQIAIPCRRSPENLTLLLEMNKALESMKADGTLGQISIKYFEQDVSK